MKLDHEVLQRNYQKAVEYVKTHYADITINGYNCVCAFDGLTQMEREIKGTLFSTVKNGELLLGRNIGSNDFNDKVIKIVERPTDIDIVNFLGERFESGGWNKLKQECDQIMDNYHFATNFDPSKSRE